MYTVGDHAWIYMHLGTYIHFVSKHPVEILQQHGPYKKHLSTYLVIMEFLNVHCIWQKLMWKFEFSNKDQCVKVAFQFEQTHVLNNNELLTFVLLLNLLQNPVQ